MPQRHSKNNTDSSCFTYFEKNSCGIGSIKQRLGTDSQLPFGYCCLSLHPVIDPVVSPSGHIYSREAIVEYLLTKTLENKRLAQAYAAQQDGLKREQHAKTTEADSLSKQSFVDTQEGVCQINKRKAVDIEDSQTYLKSRQRVIDDADNETKLAELRQISPWIPQFTPEAKESDLKPPPKRAPSPMTGNPLRSKDLIPITLEREVTGSEGVAGSSGPVRFICPISRKTITNQKVILIKSTGAVMLESTAQTLAYKTMICPLTSRSFQMEDVLELVAAASGFAASGTVEATKYRPTMN